MSEMTRGVDGDRMAALFGRCLHLHAETSGEFPLSVHGNKGFTASFCSISFEQFMQITAMRLSYKCKKLFCLILLH